MDGEWLLYMNPREDVAMAIANRIKFLAVLDSHDSSISKLGHIKSFLRICLNSCSA